MKTTSHTGSWKLTDALWTKMEPLLPKRPAHPLGCHRPRVPDRNAMAAFLFVLRTGCQWNALDATGICSCASAYRRFREWLDCGVFHEFWRQGLLVYDDAKGIDWNWLSLDGAMTKAPLGGKKTGPNPTDRGKDGTKRSLLADGVGFPAGLTIDGANRNDHKLMAETIASIPVDRPRPTRAHPQGLCLDKGYDYPEARSVGIASGFTLHLRSRGEEKRELECKPGVKARRWVVERTHGWMNRFRRILVRWEIREDTYFAMLHFVCGIVAWRASGLLK